MRTLLKLVLGVAVVAVAVIAQPQAKPDERSGADRFEVRMTDEMLRHSRIRDVLYFVGNAWTIGVFLVLIKTGAAGKMKAVAERVTRKPFVVAMFTIALLVLVTSILSFPLTYYSGFHVPQQFDLSDQSFGSWMSDYAKGSAVNLAIVVPVGALALLAMRRMKRWWLALWLGTIPFVVFAAVIQPIVIDPIFNEYEPLKDVVLRQKLLDLASRAGIEGGRVFEVNASKQTKTLNAYVNGIGPTARIVMWDTLLAEMTHDEVLAVMGHEMGHYVRKDVWKGLGVGILGALIVYLVGYRIIERGVARRGYQTAGDPAVIPYAALVFFVLAFLTTPFGAAYSRWGEHQADIFSLELTGLNEPMATAFRKLAESSKRDPSPHPFIKYWRYSHPPIAERIPFALSYRPHSQPSSGE
ncbi:MAG TPA: M48 family metallopeptidase [Thermoanaerobaculia bacterium]|nr:M48 family metallopeptidase [Thermoanaerobaculia bacterium]